MVIPRLYPVALVGLVLAGCTGDVGPTGPEGPAGPTGSDANYPVATTVEVSPSSLTLADGASAELTAIVRAQDGAVMNGVAVTWTSDDAGVASLSPVGGATVDPTKVLVTQAGGGTATITASVGSVSGTSAVFCFPVAAAAYFSVRSGTTINPIGIPGIFDGGPDETFVEFPLDFPATTVVTFEFKVFDFISGSSDPPTINFNVAVYDANGAEDASDYGGGVLLTNLTLPSGALQSYSLDVTSDVTSLRSAGATHIGFRFYQSSFGQLALQDGAGLDGS